MKFELAHDRRNIKNADLIADIRRVASGCSAHRFTQTTYREHGTYAVRTIIRRYGTWNKAVEAAGLPINVKRNISEEELFSAIGELWIRLGRQPKYSELTKPLFPFSAKPYEQHFGSWRKALEAFVAFAHSKDMGRTPNPAAEQERLGRRTPRSINLRLRFQVLQRDHFKCCSCGASPTLKPGTRLEVDHIIPWSKGGETLLENLQTRCSACNQGKSNQP